MENKDIENEADVDMVDELMAFLDESNGDGAATEISQSALKLTRDNIKALIMVSTYSYILLFC